EVRRPPARLGGKNILHIPPHRISCNRASTAIYSATTPLTTSNFSAAICPERAQKDLSMRIASFLFDELDVNDFRPATQKTFVTGRSLLTKWIVESVAAHPDIAEFAVCGVGEPPLAKTSAVSFPQISSWLAQGDAVWFEPARH